MNTRFRLSCFAALVGVVLLLSSCATPKASPEQQIKDDQTRLDQQRKGYPDKESPEQQKEVAERARKEDMLKK